jgi:hypothetical protein
MNAESSLTSRPDAGAAIFLEQNPVLFPIGYGALQAPAGFVATPRRVVERQARQNLTSEGAVVPVHTVVFDVVIDLLEEHVELRTTFSGEQYGQDLLDHYSRVKERSEPTLLAQALWLQSVDHGVKPTTRELAALFLGIVVGWPARFFSRMLDMQRGILANRFALHRIPSIWSIHFAAKLLRICHEQGPVPTGITALVEGGMGLNWTTSSTYADVEVTNDEDVIFSLSPDRRAVNVLRAANSDEGLREGLKRVRELLGSAP